MVESGAELFRAFEIVGMALRSGLSCCKRWFTKSGWMSPSAGNSIAIYFCSSAPFDCQKMWPKNSCCEANRSPTSSVSHSDAGGSERRRPASGGSTWLLGCLLMATSHGRMSRKQPELWQRISFRVYRRLMSGMIMHRRHGRNSVNKPFRSALLSIPRIFPCYSPIPYTPRASPSGYTGFGS